MKKRAIVALMVLLVPLALMSPACAAETQPPADAVTRKGMVDANNHFVDENGQTYEMAANEKAATIMAHPGKRVEIKGTVMEKDGVKTLVVERFITLPE